MTASLRGRQVGKKKMNEKKIKSYSRTLQHLGGHPKCAFKQSVLEWRALLEKWK